LNFSIFPVKGFLCAALALVLVF